VSRGPFPPSAPAPPGGRPVAARQHPGAERCTTCGDVAVRMRVLGVSPERELARCVDADGVELAVDTGLLEDVRPGETLLVHAGSALARDAGAAR
jgi:hydrogenase expression/formation protein HypC